jgi:cytochrome c oxidase subunit I+III
MSDQRTPEPTELIYVPGPSWAPPIIATGLAIVLAGTFTAWFWSVIGAFILLLGLRSWWQQSDDEVSRMRRHQSVDTAVIPAEPIRRSSGS